MEKALLAQTVEKVTDWTEGKFLAERFFYSKSNLIGVVIRPFVFELNRQQLIACSEEGYLPQDVYMFFGEDSVELAKRVREFVIYDMKHE